MERGLGFEMELREEQRKALERKAHYNDDDDDDVYLVSPKRPRWISYHPCHAYDAIRLFLFSRP